MQNNSTLARLLAAALASTLALGAHAATAGEQAQPAAQTEPAVAPAAAQADSDAAIVEKVKAALKADPALANLPIEVSSKDGVVTLAGTVPAASVEPALKLAATVPGIKEVRSELKAG